MSGSGRGRKAAGGARMAGMEDEVGLKDFTPGAALALMLLGIPLAAAMFAVWVCAVPILLVADEPALRMLPVAAVGWLLGCLVGFGGMLAWVDERYG